MYNLPAYEEMQVQTDRIHESPKEKNYYSFEDKSILVGIVNILEGKERGIYWNRRKS